MCNRRRLIAALRKFINFMMKHGKKTVAERIFLDVRGGGCSYASPRLTREYCLQTMQRIKTVELAKAHAAAKKAGGDALLAALPAPDPRRELPWWPAAFACQLTLDYVC